MQTRPRPLEEPNLLEVRGLTKVFSGGIRAADNVSFTLRAGEAFGLVGESGSGKSTTARCIVGLIAPTGGEVLFEGFDLTSAKRLNKTIRRRIQIVFQNPYSSLNPRMTVGALVGEGLRVHKMTKNKEEFNSRVDELLQLVGLHPSLKARHPRALSGGQRQRVSLARALAVQPDILICDEPVSSLDVSIQAQIINLLSDLREHLGLTILFIAHDLAVVRQLCDRVAVMYQGRIVELAPTVQLFSRPRHPYTKELLLSVPSLDRRDEERRRTRRTSRGVSES